MTTQRLELSEHDSEFVRRCVQEGRYRDANEVVEAGLRRLEEREEEEQRQLERLRAEVKIGMDDLENGRYIDVHGPEELDAFFDDIDREAEAILNRESASVRASQV